MKLVSYNIQYGKGKDDRFDLDRIVSELGDPDLVALQEVETFIARSGMVDQAREIAARMSHLHWVYGPGIDVDASEVVDGKPVHRRRQFGNMVLSRWPILSVINHTLPKIALLDQSHVQRTLVETVIDAPGAPLRFCSVHLDAVAPETRMPQVEVLKEILLRGHERGASLGGPLGPDWLDRPVPPQPMSAILMGDMNFPPDSKEYDYLLGGNSTSRGRMIRSHGLADAWVLTGHDENEGDTFPTEGNPPCRIDHCFVTTDLVGKVTSMEIGDDS
ncbi:MAG: endonuclease/exonuclease/phosphatase family protein, partial [Pseudomonadota bacterium]